MAVCLRENKRVWERKGTGRKRERGVHVIGMAAFNNSSPLDFLHVVCRIASEWLQKAKAKSHERRKKKRNQDHWFRFCLATVEKFTSSHVFPTSIQKRGTNNSFIIYVDLCRLHIRTRAASVSASWCNAKPHKYKHTRCVCDEEDETAKENKKKLPSKTRLRTEKESEKKTKWTKANQSGRSDVVGLMQNRNGNTKDWMCVRSRRSERATKSSWTKFWHKRPRFVQHSLHSNAHRDPHISNENWHGAEQAKQMQAHGDSTALARGSRGGGKERGRGNALYNKTFSTFP